MVMTSKTLKEIDEAREKQDLKKLEAVFFCVWQVFEYAGINFS